MAGMNCTAWNSVCAKARDEQAERRAEDRVDDRDHRQQPHRAGDVEAEQPDADRRRRARTGRRRPAPNASA